MPVLTQGSVFRARDPTLLVENKLDVGAWRFRLTVVDDAGNESAPSDLVVQVRARTAPTGPTRPDLTRPDLVRPIDPRIVQPITPIRPVRPPG
jgi:hypothetical protein